MEYLPHRFDGNLFDNVLLSVLKIICEHETIGCDELTDILADLEHKTVFSAVDELSDLDYITIERDYSAGRKNVVYSVTAEGRDIWTDLCRCFATPTGNSTVSSERVANQFLVGIGDLDSILDGELLSGLSVLHADIENNAEIILRQITTHFLKNCSVIYVTTLATPKEIKDELGGTIERAESEDKFIFVDLIPKIYDTKYSEYSVASPDDAGRVMSVILSAYNKLKSTAGDVYIVIDSLDDIIQEFSELVAHRFIKKLISLAKENNSIVLSLVKKGTLSDKVVNLILGSSSTIFDLSYTLDEMQPKYFIQVKKGRNEHQLIEYKIKDGKFKIVSDHRDSHIQKRSADMRVLKHYSDLELRCAYCRSTHIIVSNINLDLNSATENELTFEIDGLYVYCDRCKSETMLYSKNNNWSDQFRDLPQFEDVYWEKVREGYYKTKYCVSCQKVVQSSFFAPNECPHCKSDLNIVEKVLISQTGDNFNRDSIEGLT